MLCGRSICVVRHIESLPAGKYIKGLGFSIGILNSAVDIMWNQGMLQEILTFILSICYRGQSPKVEHYFDLLKYGC